MNEQVSASVNRLVNGNKLNETDRDNANYYVDQVDEIVKTLVDETLPDAAAVAEAKVLTNAIKYLQSKSDCDTGYEVKTFSLYNKVIFSLKNWELKLVPFIYEGNYDWLLNQLWNDCNRVLLSWEPMVIHIYTKEREFLETLYVTRVDGGFSISTNDSEYLESLEAYDNMRW